MSEEKLSIQEKINEQVLEWRVPTGEKKLKRADKVIKKLKCDAGNCEDCGKDYKSKRTTTYRFSSNPIPHWNIKCNTCNLWLNPITNKFDMEYYELYNYYNHYVKNKLKKAR